MSETEAQSELEELMNAAAGLAEEMLREFGEFLPYGAAITQDGAIVSVVPEDEDDDAPSDQLIEAVRDNLRDAADNGQFKATATVYDVTLTAESGETSDAIAFELEHSQNYSVVALLPYAVADGDVEYGEALAQDGTHHVFRVS